MFFSFLCHISPLSAAYFLFQSLSLYFRAFFPAVYQPICVMHSTIMHYLSTVYDKLYTEDIQKIYRGYTKDKPTFIRFLEEVKYYFVASQTQHKRLPANSKSSIVHCCSPSPPAHTISVCSLSLHRTSLSSYHQQVQNHTYLCDLYDCAILLNLCFTILA